MTIEKMLRLIAGLFVMASVALAATHSIHWLWFTGFVGLNLFQSGITNWCPMVNILRAFGFKSCSAEKVEHHA